MEIKQSITLEETRDGHLYRLEMPVGAPYGEAIDVSFAFFTKIEEMAREAFNKAKEDREKAVKEAAQAKDEGAETEDLR